MSKQYIDGAGFSLERFTEGVPQDGRYYLVRDSLVVEVYETQEEAQLAYHGLCLSYWSEMLLSQDMRARLQAARGLLRRDREHRIALETLATYGDTKEKNYAAESLKRLARQHAVPAA